MAIVAVSAATCVQALPACREAVLVQPAPLVVESQDRPTLVWAALPGVRAYRVTVESRVPNGRVLETIDASVNEPSFTPPRALATQFAVVKARVTADCPDSDASPISARGPSFFIDPRVACPAPGSPTLTGSWVEWGVSTEGADTEITFFEAMNGDLVARGMTRAGRYVLPRAGGAFLLALRNRCGEHWSGTLYRVLAAGP